MTPAILLIDTTSSPGQVAFARGPEVLGERLFSSTRRQAEQLFPLIRELLAEQDVRREDLDVITVLTGPGAFTSIRVGITAAKGLAEALGIPIVAISAMEILARLATAFPVALALPASRGELFLGVAESATGGEPRIVSLDVVAPERWRDNLAVEPRCVVSTDRALLASLTGSLPDYAKCLVSSTNWMETLALLSSQRWNSRLFADALSLDAAYVRKTDADANWTDQRLESARNE